MEARAGRGNASGRGGPVGEELLIGCGSGEWEEPDLRDWRGIISWASLQCRGRGGLVTASFSLHQP